MSDENRTVTYSTVSQKWLFVVKPAASLPVRTHCQLCWRWRMQIFKGAVALPALTASERRQTQGCVVGDPAAGMVAPESAAAGDVIGAPEVAASEAG